MHSSKLTTSLLVIIIALLAVCVWLLVKNNYSNSRLAPVSSEEKVAKTTADGWEYTSVTGFIVAYNPDWHESPYLDPVPGKSNIEVVGYMFTLPSESIIEWGGSQSACASSDVSPFAYGVSSVACVKGKKAAVHVQNVRLSLTSADLSAFGDFVRHNQ